MAKRILVAEDEPDNRGIVVKVLTLEGYQTLEAADGRSALALARRERPDLIVMDLGMPEMDGWEASPAQGGSANGRYPGHQRSPHSPCGETRSGHVKRDVMATSRNPAGRRRSVRSSCASSRVAEWSRPR